MARIFLYSLLATYFYGCILTIKQEEERYDRTFMDKYHSNVHPTTTPAEIPMRAVDKRVEIDIKENIEKKFELYPYIVALLNLTKDFQCTGSIVNKRTVLTASNCIDPRLKYIGVGLAIVDPEDLNENALKIIVGTQVYGNTSAHMHSKVGLVYSATNDLNIYFEAAILNRYANFNEEPRTFEAVGYGLYLNKTLYALQIRQLYRIPCLEGSFDKATVCGVIKHFDGQYLYDVDTFAKGGVILIAEEVVALTGWKCGIFDVGYHHNTEQTHNISCEVFTPIGQYPEIVRMREKQSDYFVYEKNPEILFRTIKPNSSWMKKSEENIKLLLVFAVLKILLNSY